MNEKSYTDLQKMNSVHRTKFKETFVQNLYIDMLLSEIQLTTEKEKLKRKIDEAIDRHDKMAFLSLSEKLKELNKKLGA